MRIGVKVRRSRVILMILWYFHHASSYQPPYHVKQHGGHVFGSTSWPWCTLSVITHRPVCSLSFLSDRRVN